jgi:hypothetical protein
MAQPAGRPARRSRGAAAAVFPPNPYHRNPTSGPVAGASQTTASDMDMVALTPTSTLLHF